MRVLTFLVLCLMTASAAIAQGTLPPQQPETPQLPPARQDSTPPPEQPAQTDNAPEIQGRESAQGAEQPTAPRLSPANPLWMWLALGLGVLIALVLVGLFARPPAERRIERIERYEHHDEHHDDIRRAA